MKRKKLHLHPNPDREIRFFKHDSEKIVYVFLSLQMSMDAFYKMFPAAIQITESNADEFILEQDHKVVYVGDSDIIDEYFNTEEIKAMNKESIIRFAKENQN